MPALLTLGLILLPALAGTDASASRITARQAPAQAAGRPGEPRVAGTPTTLFINFDGAVLRSGCGNDARYNCSTLAARFDGYVEPFAGPEVSKMGVLQTVRKRVADFGVRVVGVRPPDDEEYSMVLYGDLGPQSFAGVAPYIDCEDRFPRDTSFCQGFTGSNTGATVVLQEAAHTWGLEHVDAEFDILHPFKTSGNRQFFLDECNVIVSDTELDTTAGTCNAVHTRFCPAGQQNSYQELLHLFGPAIADTAPPTVELTTPSNDEQLPGGGRIPVRGTIRDDLEPQIYSITYFLNDERILQTDATRIDVTFTDPPAGVYDLRAVVRDRAGNVGEDAVTFEVVPPPRPGVPVDDALEPSATLDSCSATPAGARGRWGGLWLGLGFCVLGVGRRRKRA